jgi:hypothetical protein
MDNSTNQSLVLTPKKERKDDRESVGFAGLYPVKDQRRYLSPNFVKAFSAEHSFHERPGKNNYKLMDYLEGPIENIPFPALNSCVIGTYLDTLVVNIPVGPSFNGSRFVNKFRLGSSNLELDEAEKVLIFDESFRHKVGMSIYYKGETYFVRDNIATKSIPDISILTPLIFHTKEEHKFLWLSQLDLVSQISPHLQPSTWNIDNYPRIWRFLTGFEDSCFFVAEELEEHEFQVLSFLTSVSMITMDDSVSQKGRIAERTTAPFIVGILVPSPGEYDMAKQILDNISKEVPEAEIYTKATTFFDGMFWFWGRSRDSIDYVLAYCSVIENHTRPKKPRVFQNGVALDTETFEGFWGPKEYNPKPDMMNVSIKDFRFTNFVGHLDKYCSICREHIPKDIKLKFEGSIIPQGTRITSKSIEFTSSYPELTSNSEMGEKSEDIKYLSLDMPLFDEDSLFDISQDERNLSHEEREFLAATTMKEMASQKVYNAWIDQSRLEEHIPTLASTPMTQSGSYKRQFHSTEDQTKLVGPVNQMEFGGLDDEEYDSDDSPEAEVESSDYILETFPSSSNNP